MAFSTLCAQEKQNGELYFGFDFNTNLGGSDRSLPYWLHANQYGIYDQGSANGVAYIRFSKPLFSNDKFSFSASGKLYGRVAEHSDVGMNTLSGTAEYSFLKLRFGKFVDPMGMNYHPLSSGSMMYSTNSEPVPKITIQTDDFVDIPLTKGYVQFSSYLSHGWFEDSRYIKNAWLHQKYFYLKVNYSRFEGIGGIIHNVQWGGIHPEQGQLPNSLSDYFRMFVAEGASGSSNAPGGEISNSLGNSVAAYDFNLRVNLERYRLTFYRLFYLEDKVSSRFRSPWDGMWGAGIIRKEETPVLKEFLYEHINTKRQDSYDFEPRGTQNYYNNFIYQSGWTYKNRVLGNPLILTDGSDVRPIYNNIIVAHHIGASGFLSSNVRWKAFYTFSRNYGYFRDQIIRITGPGPQIRAELRDLEELKKVNHSILMETNLMLPQDNKINFDLGVAMDFGELYSSPRIGVRVGCSYKIY